MPDSLVPHETLLIDSLNAWINVSMTKDTLRTSQMFGDFDTVKDYFEVNRVKDMITLPIVFEVVFAQMFGIDVSMITVSFVEVTSASATLIAFCATGSGLPMSAISWGSTQMTGPFNQEFVNKGLSYTVSRRIGPHHVLRLGEGVLLRG